MTALSKMKVEVNEKEIVFIRMFDAPRKLVWDAWTKKEHLVVWWGPHTFTNSDCSVDLRKGGKFLITMNDPDGKGYPCEFVYHEIEPVERLVMSEDMETITADWGETGPPPSSLMTLLFEEQGNRTKLTIISRFKSNEDRDKILAMQAAEGWAQSFERLEALLAKR